jgi:hypothetical protein
MMYVTPPPKQTSAKDQANAQAAKDAKREAAEEEVGLRENKKKTSKLDVKQSEMTG